MTAKCHDWTENDVMHRAVQNPPIPLKKAVVYLTNPTGGL